MSAFFRVFGAVWLTAAVALAAPILPDHIGAAARTSVTQPDLPDRPVWQEYGLQQAEQAQYGNYAVTVYRFKDTTGAFAGFQWLRPAQTATEIPGELGVTTPDGALRAEGNYLFRFQGHQPDGSEWQALVKGLAHVDHASYPMLGDFLPAQGRSKGSERYLLGPASLAKFEPRLSPAVVRFDLGAEGEVATYTGRNGPMTLLLLSYPTPAMARQQLSALQIAPGAVVQRRSSLIEMVLGSPNQAAAERLLGSVRYDTSVTLTQVIPKPDLNPGVMMIDIFMLAGILIAASVLAGLFMGGFRTWFRSGGKGQPDPMIMLHLSDQ